MDLQGRPLRESDIEAVLALVHCYDREFFGEEMMDAEDVLGEWQAPSFDFARDSLGYLDASGRLVAAGSITGRGTVEVTVDPPLRPGPTETQMIQHFQRVARERGLREVQIHLAEGDHVGRELLAGLGWRPSYTSWVLQLRADAAITTRELPAGYAIRPFRPDDAHPVYRVIYDAFAEWQPTQRSFADWEATVLRRPGGDPGRFRVATFADEASGSAAEPVVVGASVVFDGADEAWVAQLAVHRDHRNRGLAQQLLAETYAAARERGVAKGGLSTDTRTGALGLYERLGMTVFCSYVCWTLGL